MVFAIKSWLEGSSLAMDEIISQRVHPPEIEAYVREVFVINEKYATKTMPIGLVRPEAEEELRELLEKITSRDHKTDTNGV